MHLKTILPLVISWLYKPNAVPRLKHKLKIVRKLLQIRGLHNYNYDDFVNATSFVEDHHLKYPFEDSIEKEFILDDIDGLLSLPNKASRLGLALRSAMKNKLLL